MPQFTKDELLLLEEQSLENMLVFYEAEMKRIAEGERASSLLGGPMIRRLLELGLLERGWGGKNWRIMMSRKGRELYGLPPHARE